MQRGRSQDATERNAAIGRVDMQLVAAPECLIALGASLDADIRGAWQIVEHLRQGHPQLALQAARRLGPLLALARTTAPSFRGGRWLRRWFLASFNRRRIARHVTDQVIPQGLVDQRLVQAARQGAVSEGSEGTRERRLAGDLLGPAPATQATQRGVDGQTLNEPPGGRDGEHRLGDEGACQRRTVLLRAPRQATQARQELFHLHEAEHRDEQLVALSQRAEFFFECREQLSLKGEAIIR